MQVPLWWLKRRQPVLRCGCAPVSSTSKRAQQTTFAQLMFWNCSEAGFIFNIVQSNTEAAFRTAARGPQCCCKTWKRAGISYYPGHSSSVGPHFIYWELLGSTWAEWSLHKSLCWVFLINYTIGTETSGFKLALFVLAAHHSDRIAMLTVHDSESSTIFHFVGGFPLLCSYFLPHHPDNCRHMNLKEHCFQTIFPWTELLHRAGKVNLCLTFTPNESFFYSVCQSRVLITGSTCCKCTLRFDSILCWSSLWMEQLLQWFFSSVSPVTAHSYQI